MGSIAPSAFKIEPLNHGPGKKSNFGAVITDLDLNNVDDNTIAQLRDEIWKNKMVVVKNQRALEPRKQWELMKRLDPAAPAISRQETAYSFYPPETTGNNLFGILSYISVLDDGEVLTIGKGYQGDDHYGKKNFDMGKADFLYYYAKPLSEEDFENGKTRWHWWHLDGTFYQYEPPTFTSFRSLKLPNEEREQEVEWADGSGLSMKVKPGRTAFLDTAQLYNMLSDDEKKMADHSWVEYMWYPYEYVKACRGNPNGIGVASEGKETPMEEMEKIANVKPEWQKTHPMVWVNPVTGEKSFQVQHNCARRLFLRSSPSEAPKVIDDVAEVRRFLSDIQERILKPEYIWVGPPEEGDIMLFQNWGLNHSKIDYPLSWGSRTAHQVWLPGAVKPVGPVPIPEA
ncbi:alpha-ketoglutarate dependent dioxygenase [Phyllosticta capitalensis]|uniref:Alpha-ketoglutarate dependent dioxygenase n=1 Tax=Phyllosticta capitalensis TaxID=121624 RepID=A0ABR1YNM7_9PEZI